MTRFALLITLIIACSSVFADDDHSGHSDDLLLILKDKIALQKLIKGFDHLPSAEQVANLQQQSKLFQRMMHRLSNYMAIAENHYPNLQMYHESLKSRAALLSEITQLIAQYHSLQIRNKEIP